MSDGQRVTVVTVVGIGVDGWPGLTDEARRAVEAADVVLGSERQLGLLPVDAEGRQVGAGHVARRVAWPSPLLSALPRLLAVYDGRAVCVLASGDPMFFGIGTTLARLIGTDRLRVLPHPSSVSLACARLGWGLDGVDVVSVVGRPLAAVHPAVQPGRRLIVLSQDATTPAALGALLVARGYRRSPMTVLENLGGAAERMASGTAVGWNDLTSKTSKNLDLADPSLGDPNIADLNIADLNLVAVECRLDPGGRHLPRTPGLPDDAYEHDGQITKAEVRALTVCRLGPAPGELLWDVGAGSGSIGIEWMRTHPACQAIAVEPRADRAARVGRNAEALGVPGLRVVVGRAPEALNGLPCPSAVFVGGGMTAPGVLDGCWDALPPGGRLVANAVTVESEGLLATWHARHGGDLVRLSVSRASPVGGFTGWRPMMPVTQWTVTKPPAGQLITSADPPRSD